MMTPREALEFLRPFHYGDPQAHDEAVAVLLRTIEQHEEAEREELTRKAWAAFERLGNEK